MPKWDERGRGWEKKNLLVRSISTQPGIGNSRKIAKKFKKMKNIIMASFKAKTRRDRLRMRGKKKKSFWSIHTWLGIGNSKKTAKKLKKHQYGFFSSQNGMVEAENDTKRKFSFWTIPTGPGRGNSRKIAKKLKNVIWILFKPKQDGTG